MFVRHFIMGEKIVHSSTTFLNWNKSCQIYLYSAFHNTDLSKLLHSINQKQLNSVCLLLEKWHPSLVELINGMMGHLIWISLFWINLFII